MEDIVRAILESRTVSLEPSDKNFNFYGFKCLGVAEKSYDLDGLSDSLVYIWHVKSDILPVSKNEIERWSIDAPGNQHWILSEREIPEGIFDNITNGIRVIAWGPDKLSRWIGESVLRGDLSVGSEIEDKLSFPEEKISDLVNKGNQNEITLLPIIRLDDWLQTEPSGSLHTLPVFLEVKLWKVSGLMLGPGSISDQKSWTFIEDPWMNKIIPFNKDQILLNPPNLTKFISSKKQWLTVDQLKSNLKPMLDYRKKEETNETNELVTSTMLEWWRVDLPSLNLNFEFAKVPAWKLRFEDGVEKILHSYNGKTYEL
tara:strand:+ start:1786 stop:2727 length:942 start_codon:yes stop_codon:yes gene_type:complete